MARDLIDKLRKKIKDNNIFEAKHKVILADSRTVKNLDQGVKLNLILRDRNAHTYRYSGEFLVLDMKTNDIILGLPALTGKLYPFMEALSREAHEKDSEEIPLEKQQEVHADDSEDLCHLKECLNPLFAVDYTQLWAQRNDDVAPEDEETGLPVQFKDGLAFHGKSREEALKDYHELSRRM